METKYDKDGRVIATLRPKHESLDSPAEKVQKEQLKVLREIRDLIQEYLDMPTTRHPVNFVSTERYVPPDAPPLEAPKKKAGRPRKEVKSRGDK